MEQENYFNNLIRWRQNIYHFKRNSKIFFILNCKKKNFKCHAYYNIGVMIKCPKISNLKQVLINKKNFLKSVTNLIRN